MPSICIQIGNKQVAKESENGKIDMWSSERAQKHERSKILTNDFSTKKPASYYVMHSIPQFVLLLPFSIATAFLWTFQKKEKFVNNSHVAFLLVLFVRNHSRLGLRFSQQNLWIFWNYIYSNWNLKFIANFCNYISTNNKWLPDKA